MNQISVFDRGFVYDNVVSFAHIILRISLSQAKNTPNPNPGRRATKSVSSLECVHAAHCTACYSQLLNTL